MLHTLQLSIEMPYAISIWRCWRGSKKLWRIHHSSSYASLLLGLFCRVYIRSLPRTHRTDWLTKATAENQHFLILIVQEEEEVLSSNIPSTRRSRKNDNNNNNIILLLLVLLLLWSCYNNNCQRRKIVIMIKKNNKV